jgi:hypothetical protein
MAKNFGLYLVKFEILIDFWWLKNIWLYRTKSTFSKNFANIYLHSFSSNFSVLPKLAILTPHYFLPFPIQNITFNPKFSANNKNVQFKGRFIRSPTSNWPHSADYWLCFGDCQKRVREIPTTGKIKPNFKGKDF